MNHFFGDNSSFAVLVGGCEYEVAESGRMWPHMRPGCAQLTAEVKTRQTATQSKKIHMLSEFYGLYEKVLIIENG